MPSGKDNPEDLLHREPRLRAPREDLRVHRLKEEDPDLETSKVEESKMTQAALLPLEMKTQIVQIIDGAAGELEKQGNKELASGLDSVQNELDALFTNKEAATPGEVVKNYILDASRSLMDAVNSAERTSNEELTKKLKGFQRTITVLLNYAKRKVMSADKQAEGDALLKALKSVSEALNGAHATLEQTGDTDVVKQVQIAETKLKEIMDFAKHSEAKAASGLELDLEEGYAITASTKDVIAVRVMTEVRLVGEPDSSGFRIPSFVKEATITKWKEAIASLLESGKAYQQDGTPDYGTVIDTYKQNLLTN